MVSVDAYLDRMLAFDGCHAAFGTASGPCQRDIGLSAEDFGGRSQENHANILTGITSILVRTSIFGGVKVGDTGIVTPPEGEAQAFKVRDREIKTDGKLVRLYLVEVP